MTTRPIPFVVGLLACISISSTLNAAQWYVDASVAASGDGTAWSTAFKKIQEGINAAADADTVTVSQGVYQENIQFKGKNIVLTGTNALDPGVIAKTIIQGRQLGPTVTFSGTERPSCSLSGFTVWDGKAGSGGAIRGNGTRATIGLNIITGGTADSYGGGLYRCDGLIHLNVITVNSSGLGGGALAFCNGSIQFNMISDCWSSDGGALYQCHGLIQHNTITDCSASNSGGGLCDCDGDILNNTITNNTITSSGAWGPGGGLYGCDGNILNNTITFCSARDGGGLASCGKPGVASTRIVHNTITANEGRFYEMHVSGGGGALYDCHGTIENNTITRNRSSVGGGLGGCSGVIQNNLIADNEVEGGDHEDYGGMGGGLALCNGFIRNNLIAANWAYGGDHEMLGYRGGLGGGLARCGGTIENNTITENVTYGQEGVGGGVGCCGGTIRNCIIWNNSASQAAQVFESDDVTYCCIQGWGKGGEGNTALNPQLCDPDGLDDDPSTIEDNDCHLEWNSPCIDAGRNEAWMSGALDLDGNNRIFFGGKSKTVDMGAYEYRSFRFTIVGAERTSSNQLKLTWTSRPGDTYVIMSTSGLLSPFWSQAGTVPSQGAETTWSGSTTPSWGFFKIGIQ